MTGVLGPGFEERGKDSGEGPGPRRSWRLQVSQGWERWSEAVGAGLGWRGGVKSGRVGLDGAHPPQARGSSHWHPSLTGHTLPDVSVLKVASPWHPEESLRAFWEMALQLVAAEEAGSWGSRGGGAAFPGLGVLSARSQAPRSAHATCPCPLRALSTDEYFHSYDLRAAPAQRPFCVCVLRGTEGVMPDTLSSLFRQLARQPPGWLDVHGLLQGQIYSEFFF